MSTPQPSKFDDHDDANLDFQEEWLSAYLDDELSAGQRSIVEQRINVDPLSALMLRDLEQIRGLVRSLPAWSGKQLQVPVAELRLNESATAIAPTAVADRAQVDGNFHDELRPPVDHSLTSDSIDDVLQSDSPHRQNGSTDRPPDRPMWRWLRPVALAASLLLALGLGLMLWPAAAPRNLATSTRVTEVAAAPMVDAPEPALNPQAEQSASAGASADAAAPQAETETVQFDSKLELGYQAQPSLPAAPMMDSMRREKKEDGQGAGLPEVKQPAMPMEPGTLQPSTLPSSTLPSSTLQPSTLAPSTRPFGAAVKNGPALQLARSATWSQTDILAALSRIAPLLNLTLDNTANGGRGRLNSALGTSAAQVTAEPQIPVVVVARNRSDSQGSQLLVLLKSNNFGLTGVTQDESSALVPGLIPFGTPPSETAVTIALLVDRSQAELILAAAKQAGEITANPVWITSATSLHEESERERESNASDKEVNQKDSSQKVVVLFSPP